jgi:hypothetical protein
MHGENQPDDAGDGQQRQPANTRGHPLRCHGVSIFVSLHSRTRTGGLGQHGAGCAMPRMDTISSTNAAAQATLKATSMI